MSDSKRPATRKGKRKASELIQLDNSILNQTPKDVAQSLLSILPPDAQIHPAAVHKLLQSMDLVKAELQHRVNIMVAESLKQGGQHDVAIAGVFLPQNVLQRVFTFLPKYHALVSVSLVSRAWLAVIRSPQFWPTLDNSTGLLEQSSTVLNSTALVKVLKNSTFSSLNRLAFPEKVQSKKMLFEQIAKSCPVLEDLDMGDHVWTKMKIDNHTLAKLPELFPHLKSISFNTYKLTDSAVSSFCRAMGGRLVSLSVSDSFNCHKKLSDATLMTIGEYCPNLERFDFLNSYSSYNTNVLQFSHSGCLALLKGCPNLKCLSLIMAHFVGIEAFEEISKNPGNLERLFVVGNLPLELDTPLQEALDVKLKSFECIDKFQHDCRVTEAREKFRSAKYW